MMNDPRKKMNRYNMQMNSNPNHASNNNRQMSQRSVNFNNPNATNIDMNNYGTNPNNFYQPNNQDNYGEYNPRMETNNMMNDINEQGQIYQQQPLHGQTQQIQVQILPQDDNWGENTTAITGDFSDFNDDITEDGRSVHFNTKSSKFNGHATKDHMNNVFLDLGNHGNYNESGGRSMLRSLNIYCSNYFGFICAVCISICTFITPIMFIVLPRINIVQDWQVTECGLECESLLIGVSFKLFILLFGCWAVFCRKPRALLPRIYELRAILVFLMFIMTFSFWLFYIVRIIENKTNDYYRILQFSVSYIDVLLFIYIVAVFIIKIRHIQPEFVVKVVRSPDGEHQQYTIGKMSIQRAAVWLLEQYYKDFAVYNPWLENSMKRGYQILQVEQTTSANNGANRKRRNNNMVSNPNFKNYDNLEDKMDIDNNDANGGNEGMMNGTLINKKKMNSSRMNASTATSIVGGNYTANDRFYEEYEYERRVRKRRARLLTTTEEAFTHIRRIQADNGSINNGNSNTSTIMDPYEAAQAVFSSIARDLRRYLRVTKQQPYFTRDSIVAHLANCISYDMSPRSFLQRYLNNEPLLFNERALVNAAQQNQKLSSIIPNAVGSHGVNYHLNLKTLDQAWILICDTVLYQNLEDNLMIVLKQNDVSLMCTFKRLPRFNLIEDILDPKRNKFVLKLNSETTV